jgi:hypothetical protein
LWAELIGQFALRWARRALSAGEMYFVIAGASRQSSWWPSASLVVTGIQVRPVSAVMGPVRGFGEVERSFVFGSDGGIEEVGVPQAHVG